MKRMLLTLTAIRLMMDSQAQTQSIELSAPDLRAGGQFGASSGGLPDLTGDGVGEFYVFGSNRAYVYSGASLEILHTFQADHCGIGNPTYSPGDLNGDGVPDLMLAKRCGTDLAGSVDVVSGATGELLFTLESPNPVGQGFFGGTIRALPDMTGDGQNDWLIHQRENQSRAGRVYVFDSVSRTAVRTIQNTESAYRFWMQHIEVIPDVDRDGLPEMLVSSIEAPVRRDGRTLANAGRSVVLSLATGKVLYELQNPEPAAEGGFGLSIGGVGDLTGDGIGETAAAAFTANGIGALYFFDGANGRWLRTLRSPTPQPSAWFGRFTTLPDLNGDDVPEVLTQARAPALVYVYDGTTGKALQTFAYPGDTGTRVTFLTTPIFQESTPGLRGYLFAAPLAGDSQTGRVHFLPFISVPQAPRLSGISQTAAGVTLRVQGGGDLEVQATEDFKSWQPIKKVRITQSEPLEVTDGPTASTQKFYRAVQME